jgi:hypothetical protein
LRGRQDHNDQKEHKTMSIKRNGRPCKLGGTQDHGNQKEHQDHND